MDSETGGLRFCEVAAQPRILDRLIALSGDWEAEQSCYGYRKNAPEDFAGKRLFAAWDQTRIVGYLLGTAARAERMRSIMPDGTPFFEVEELYVCPRYRGQGVGKSLFLLAETAAREAGLDYVLLSAVSRNTRAILHFYLDELGMEFWSARLFKKLRGDTEP